MGQSIVLIGMPGAGKSTVGVLLAKALGMNFVDTDVLIQVREKNTLQEIMESRGYLALRNIEEQTLLNLALDSIVIATGGSAIYGEQAMDYLASEARIVFINVPLEVLRARIHNYDNRGIARRLDQSFEELYEERYRLYHKYADDEILGDTLSAAEIVDKITQSYSS
ncbi:MAG: shikimate kinase [Pseudomonadales bacterium]|nr:shikimate kinase [Pseudomonadales bacterium]